MKTEIKTVMFPVPGLPEAVRNTMLSVLSDDRKSADVELEVNDALDAIIIHVYEKETTETVH